MEFFDWMGVPQAILGFFNFDGDQSLDSILAIQMKMLVITLIVAAGLYLLGHLFGGFGLYKIAKRAGDKFAWMAFVPILNTYLAGRIAGETNVFGFKVKHMGVLAAILEFVYIAVNVFTLVLSMLMLNNTFYGIVDRKVGETVFRSLEMKAIEGIPTELRWMVTALNVVNIIEIVWYFVVLFAFIMLYSAFFRKYYARSPFMMAFLCSIFPVRGYVLFAVRNNAPVDYNEWMQERLRRMQQQQAQQYGAPYGQPPQGQGPAEPFTDTTGSSSADGSPSDDEPFSDI